MLLQKINNLFLEPSRRTRHCSRSISFSNHVNQPVLNKTLAVRRYSTANRSRDAGVSCNASNDGISRALDGDIQRDLQPLHFQSSEEPHASISIQKLVPGDEAVLENVIDDLFDETVRRDLTKRFLAEPTYRIFVARDGDLVVGLATGLTHFHPDKDEQFFVNELAVHESYQRRGIATRLMNAILAEARAMGCEEAWLGTENVNGPALALYRKLLSKADSEEAMSVFTFNLLKR